MSTCITKIGIIQNAPLPGDFSVNLRAIVQGYRECLDHGADIVVASSAALCGVEPHNLVTRRSFINQTKAALETLSRELGHAPLLLAAYTLTIGDDELYVGMAGDGDEETDPWMQNDRSIQLVPYLLEKDCVTELENNGIVLINGSSFYVDTSDEDILPAEDNDFIVRMPCTPWFAGAATADKESRTWEATMAGSVVICCRPVGSVGGNVYGGGSGVYSTQGEILQRLPFFEAAAKVVDISKPAVVRHLPQEEELMCGALERGIRDNVRNNGFTGVCVPMDDDNSALLAVLCIEALGISNVSGISFDKENKLAEKLGITSFTAQLDDLQNAAATALGGEGSQFLQKRLQTAIGMTHAESRGIMLCSTLNRRQIMLGDFCMYGESGGHLAPLGNLYDVDIYLLSVYLKEKYSHVFGALAEPPHGTTNRIIHELADLNTAPTSLLNAENNYLFKENDVRLIQRKLLASALKRTQMPIIVHVDAPSEQLTFPVTHRLND
ncbi:MAG: hypothetical protein IKW19_00375 [Akkermansia sp.]|nr:hypothetical protein [Akkermansia sp.]